MRPKDCIWLKLLFFGHSILRAQLDSKLISAFAWKPTAFFHLHFSQYKLPKFCASSMKCAHYFFSERKQQRTRKMEWLVFLSHSLFEQILLSDTKEPEMFFRIVILLFIIIFFFILLSKTSKQSMSSILYYNNMKSIRTEQKKSIAKKKIVIKSFWSHKIWTVNKWALKLDWMFHISIKWQIWMERRETNILIIGTLWKYTEWNVIIIVGCES